MTACKWNGSGNPRVLTGRHDADCRGDDSCQGCQSCEQDHCRVCRRTHADGTCAECMAETREALRGIGRMCDALPAEVEHRGVEGEAMMLLGPAADPEARGHLEASVRAGRVPVDYLETADHERHPLFVLGTWDMVWRDALEHDEPAEVLTVASAVGYLDQQMTYMAAYEHVPFEDFARDVRQCAAHLEAVLHDGEQRDTGAPCMACGATLLHKFPGDELPWSTKERPVRTKEDGWACPRCRRWHTESQYRLAVAHLHREHATHLTDGDMEIRTGIKAGTIRSWAKRGHVASRRDSGRTLYAVADVEKRMRGDVA